VGIQDSLNAGNESGIMPALFSKGGGVAGKYDAEAASERTIHHGRCYER
jgi:hypothetical protein